MADFYKPKEVMQLLQYRKVLFIGDSNVLPLYKDLLSALTHKHLIRVDNLKNPKVESFFGDIALQQCGKKNSWTYWENRLFEKGDCRVEMLLTGTVMVEVVRDFIRRLRDVPSAMPQIVFTSFSPIHWKKRPHLLYSLLNDFKSNLPCSTLIIVGSGFGTVKDCFGDPLFDDIPYFSLHTSRNDEDSNNAASEKALSLGFNFLNFAFYLRNRVFRGMTVQRGWESVIVRYTTSLLLTFIAQNYMIKTPGRVNQEVMMKAISSTHENTEVYRTLLMKQATNWNGAISRELADSSADSAAENALEIMNISWRYIPGSRKDSRRTETACPSSTYDLSNEKHRQHSNSAVSSYCQQVSNSAELSTVKQGVRKVAEAVEHDKWDDESLEEGEIREPPETEPKLTEIDQGLRRLLSDISSSEESMVSSDEDKPEQELGLATREDSSEYVTIVVSDGEDQFRDGGDHSIVTFSAQDSAIINLASDDSDNESCSAEAQIVNQSTELSSLLPHLRASVESEAQAISLKTVNGDCIPWPCEVAQLGAEPLWKWWRNYIQKNDNSLVIRHPSMPDVHARIPSIDSTSVIQYARGLALAVPKIIDDLHLFFDLLKNTSFDESCFVDLKMRCEGDEPDTIAVQPAKLLSLSEELTRGSVKRVNFEITHKGTVWSPPNDAHITVCSFASYRTLASRTAPTTATRQRTPAISTPISNSHCCHTGQPSADNTPARKSWTPFSPWVPSNPIRADFIAKRPNLIIDCTHGKRTVEPSSRLITTSDVGQEVIQRSYHRKKRCCPFDAKRHHRSTDSQRKCLKLKQ